MFLARSSSRLVGKPFRDEKVRQAKALHRRGLEEIGDATENLTQARAARDDVVEARVDVSMVNDSGRCIVEKSADSAGGVGADMRRETVTEDVRKPIDKRNQAKNIAVPDVDAMRFE